MMWYSVIYGTDENRVYFARGIDHGKTTNYIETG